LPGLFPILPKLKKAKDIPKLTISLLISLLLNISNKLYSGFISKEIYYILIKNQLHIKIYVDEKLLKKICSR
jgi:hypothetical protein